MKSRSKGQSGKVRQCYLHTLIPSHSFTQNPFLRLWHPLKSPVPQQDFFDLHPVEAGRLLNLY